MRVAMPSKSMTFLNFYLGEKFGLYSAFGYELAFKFDEIEEVMQRTEGKRDLDL